MWDNLYKVVFPICFMKKSVAIGIIVGFLALFTIFASLDDFKHIGFVSNTEFCGAAHGGEFTSITELESFGKLCSPDGILFGNPIEIGGNIEWECSNDVEQDSLMITSNCQATKGAQFLCGSAHNQNFPNLETLRNADVCSQGVFVYQDFQDNVWIWRCSDSGQSSTCQATKGTADNSCDVADINKDGIVDATDQNLFGEYYGTSIVCRDSNSWCYGRDLDKDGKVGILDFSLLASCLGTKTSWQQASCVDSDGGNNIFTKGGCSDKRGNEIYDTCGSQGIVESWCEYNPDYNQETCVTNTIHMNLGVACPSGSSCSGGACVVDSAECGTATTNSHTTLTRDDNMDILCAEGNPSSVGSSSDDSKWEWSCSVIVEGYSEHSNSITCQAGKTSSTNIACGKASTSGQTYSSVAELKVAGFCSIGGTPTDPYYGLENNWGWYCYNVYDTSQVVKCSAKRDPSSVPADLECGEASTSGQTYSTAGEVENVGRCSKGIATAVGTSSTNPVWEWSCYDSNNPYRNIPCTALKTSSPNEEISCGPADKKTYSNEDDLIDLKCNAGDKISDFEFNNILDRWTWTCSDESASKYKNCEAYYDPGAHPYWRIGESQILTSADIGTAFELIWEETGLTAGSTIIFEIFEQGSIYNIRTGSNAIFEMVDSTGDAIGSWTLTAEDWTKGSGKSIREFFFNYSEVYVSPNKEGITDMYWEDIEEDKVRKVDKKEIVYAVIKDIEFGTNFKIEIRDTRDKLFFEDELAAQKDSTSIVWHAGRDKNGRYKDGTYYFQISLDDGLTWISTEDGKEFEGTYGELKVGDVYECGDDKEEGNEECDGGANCRYDCTCNFDYIDDPNSRGCIKKKGNVDIGECKWSYETIGDCDKGDKKELITYVAKDSYTLNNCVKDPEVISTCEENVGLTKKIAIIIGIILAFILIGLTVYLLLLSKKEHY